MYIYRGLLILNVFVRITSLIGERENDVCGIRKYTLLFFQVNYYFRGDNQITEI